MCKFNIDKGKYSDEIGKEFNALWIMTWYGVLYVNLDEIKEFENWSLMLDQDDDSHVFLSTAMEEELGLEGESLALRKRIKRYYGKYLCEEALEALGV